MARPVILNNKRPFYPFRRTASNAIPVNSIPEAQRHLKSFLEREPCNSDLLLRLSDSIFKSGPVTQILKSAASRKWKHSYDAEHGILKVFAMARPIHDAILPLLARFSAKVPSLTGKEDCTTLWTSEQEMFKTSAEGDMKIWSKYPDGLLMFSENLDADMIPRVAVEVGFAESYADLINDMHQWLQMAQPPAKIAIIIKIEEDTRTLRNNRRSEISQTNRQRLLLEYGDEEALNKHDVELEGQPRGLVSPGFISALKSDIAVADWVGPLSVFLEVWEMGENEPMLREPRIPILPIPEQPRNPMIRATDLIPEDYRAQFKDLGDSRAGELNMDDYRSLLQAATRRLAFRRALAAIRPMGRKENDPGYVPE
ncbi:hypothetical protein BJX76DRAFT_360616 [Aspergillus varians]